MMKLILPSRPASWLGGENYLQSIAFALQDSGLHQESRLSRGIDFRRLFKEFPNFGFIFYFLSYLTDFVRANQGINIPWAVSPHSKRVLRWVPDCQDLVMPEFFSDEQRRQRKLSIQKAVERGHAFYFSSEDSRRTFIKHYGDIENIQGIVRFIPTMGFSDEVPGTHNKFLVNGDPNIRYMYMPNQWWKHKNHVLVFEAFAKYRRGGGRRHLILSGTESDERDPNFAATIRNLANKIPSVHTLGVVSRQTQMELFYGCDVLLQPSLFEGWSTSIEEALYLGTPIIASDIDVNVEQLHNCADAVFFQKNSSDDLAVKMTHELLKIDDDKLRNRRFERKLRFQEDLKAVLNQTSTFFGLQ